MARRIGLGKGLDALLDNNDESQDANTAFPVLDTSIYASAKKNQENIVQLPVERLAPNPDQPRKNFD
jgi:hypothetical protein